MKLTDPSTGWASPPVRLAWALALAGNAAGLLALGWQHSELGWPTAVVLVAGAAGLLGLRQLRQRAWAAVCLCAAVVALVLAQLVLFAHPALLLNVLFTMSLLPQLHNAALVLASGAVFAIAPLLASTLSARGPTGGDLGLYLLFLGAQTALLASAAGRNAQRERERFDMEFLVRAMGQHGAIRLGFDAVRAESALGERLKDVQQRMLMALRQVRAAVDGVRAASQDLGGSGNQLRERTERSASGLREAAMTLEQINVIVQNSAQAALEARAMAAEAAREAAHGSSLFEQVTARMRDIDQASRRITDVIAVIDGIAFQTNILALNAAVEAARAGEQGRGFAVVAAEVRSLALRAGHAAGEVKSLIHASIQTVSSGNQLVEQAGQTIGRIVETVRKVSQAFETLSADTREHAGSIDAVTQAMRELDEVTRQNVSVAETSNRVALALRSQGNQLERVLGAFKLGDRPSTVLPDAADAAEAAEVAEAANEPAAAAPVAPAASAAAKPRRTASSAAAGEPVAAAAAQAATNVEFF